MSKGINDYINGYKVQLEKGDIQIAYEWLLKYMSVLKSHFAKGLFHEYNFGNVSPGYMDYTYFSFFDDYLRSEKLRFGIVLNHQKMRFELWLMGQNADVQKEYWELLKETEWNKGRTVMPRYSVLEVVIMESPNFDDAKVLSVGIEKAAKNAVERIMLFMHEKHV